MEILNFKFKKYFLFAVIVFTLFSFSVTEASVIIKPPNYTGVRIKASDVTKRTKINASQNSKITSGLIGFWSFNGSDINWSSNTLYDRSGNGYNGAIRGISTSTSPMAGKIGQALHFDGTNDRIVIPEIVTDIDGASDLSVSVWIKPHTLEALDTIIGKNNTSSGSTFNFRMEDSSSSNLRFNFSTSVNGHTTSNVLAVGQWTHAVAVFDGTKTGNNNRLKIYINGVAETLDFGGTTVPSTLSNTSWDMVIGSTDTSTGNRWFDGVLDEIRLYNRPLSAEEALQLYKLGR